MLIQMRHRKTTRRPRQLGLQFRTWGGARKGAGRPPKGGSPGVCHLRRPALAARFPVHVTLRVGKEVWNLRSRRSLRVIGAAFLAGAERFGMRLCEFSIQGNHVHLLLEAQGQAALARGIQGLCIRMAKGLNRMMGRTGRVFADRYHAHILRTPTEVHRARAYVRDNHRKHSAEYGHPLPRSWLDPYSSASREHGIVLPAPHTWLLGRVAEARAKARHP
jgi:putative transposase